MYRWLAAILFLAAMVPAIGAGGASTPTSALCRQERPLVRELWHRGLYDAPTGADDVVVAAIDGDVTKTRQALDALPPSEVARWRQVAMYTAAEQGQIAVVDALLDDGAPVDGSAEMPPLNSALYERTVDALSHQPPFDAKAVKRMQALGIVSNQPQESGPPIFAAIGCNDLAIVKLLLRYHIDPKSGSPTPKSIDPFISAVIFGEAEITGAFLDYGADPCIEDDRLRRNAAAIHHPPHTLANIGQRAGLSAALVKRLECHATRQ
ncbi:MAG: hypothetical protein ACREPU_05875 [Rhodanobacteraceae bacterium]